MANPPQNVLLVEGVDDREVIYQLSNFAGIPRGAFEVKPKQGYNQLLDELDVSLDASELERLGIIVDADDDLDNRWQSLQDRLQSLGYSSLPESPPPTGLIVKQADMPILGVWLMPNNVVPGMLENFAAFLIPQNDQLWNYACGVVNDIPEGQRPFRATHLAKAHIHTWLAWQPEPGTPLGLAITRRYLDAALPEAQLLIAWLKRLFNLPE